MIATSLILVLSSVLLDSHCLVSAYASGMAFSPQLSFALSTSPVKQPHKAAMPLLQAASKPQSKRNRLQVERLIDELSERADQNKALFKRPIQPGSYRTFWSTVTADSPIGSLLRQPPSNVLGGPSWQVVSDDQTKGENIVYWDFLDLRMAGLSRLQPLEEKKKGYSLEISGLEFRWGSKGCPEKTPTSTRTLSNKSRSHLEHETSVAGKSWRVFALEDHETLSNGVGTLELLYNDGFVRVTRDTVQDNTYIHLREPVEGDLETFLSSL